MKLQENKERQGCPAVFSLVVKGENYNIIYSVKSQNFDEILMFLGKFLRGRVLSVRNRVRFCQKLKRSQNYDFYTRDMYSPVRVSTLIVSPWFTKKGTWMI